MHILGKSGCGEWKTHHASTPVVPHHRAKSPQVVRASSLSAWDKKPITKAEMTHPLICEARWRRRDEVVAMTGDAKPCGAPRRRILSRVGGPSAGSERTISGRSWNEHNTTHKLRRQLDLDHRKHARTATPLSRSKGPSKRERHSRPTAPTYL